MSMDERSKNELGGAGFSFGVRELAQAAESEHADSPIALVSDLALACDKAGFDPYNSTGRFDRGDAWSRIRRR